MKYYNGNYTREVSYLTGPDTGDWMQVWWSESTVWVKMRAAYNIAHAQGLAGKRGI